MEVTDNIRRFFNAVINEAELEKLTPWEALAGLEVAVSSVMQAFREDQRAEIAQRWAKAFLSRFEPTGRPTSDAAVPPGLARDEQLNRVKAAVLATIREEAAREGIDPDVLFFQTQANMLAITTLHPSAADLVTVINGAMAWHGSAWRLTENDSGRG